MRKRILSLILVIAAAGLGGWAVVHVGVPKWQRQSADISNLNNGTSNDGLAAAVEEVKADRGEPAGGNAAVEIPPELKHYSDRHWFLATQVAEVGKYNVPTCQDFVDLAAMIQRGEMVPVPSVTDMYVLYGVGEEADEKAFSRYQESLSQLGASRDMKSVPPRGGGWVDHGVDIELYNEGQLGDAYRRLNEKRSMLEAEIATLRSQSSALKKGEREKQKELQKQLAERQQELKSTDEEKGRLAKFYGEPHSRQGQSGAGPPHSKEKLFADYQSLQSLAKNFGGRAFNIDEPSDRQAMKVAMLSSLRPEALKVLEEVASAYHRQFSRRLPVSSLVRPEQYQHALSKVNRNAVLIDTPPHSTGLAFDIDYRYMSAAEQTFVMAELARLKIEGRIEVIRERNANYHVFAFINGARPGDELITASLEDAGAPPEPETHHASEDQRSEVSGRRSEVSGRGSEIGKRRSGKRTNVKSRSQTAKSRTTKSKTRKRR